MIVTVRTLTIEEGKQEEAIAALVEIANYINDNHGANTHVERNITGPLNKVYMVGEYESLAALEGVQKKVRADEKVIAMVSAATRLQAAPPNLLYLERVS